MANKQIPNTNPNERDGLLSGGPYFVAVNSVKEQIPNSTGVRDTLLAKLMSGVIRMKI